MKIRNNSNGEVLCDIKNDRDDNIEIKSGYLVELKDGRLFLAVQLADDKIGLIDKNGKAVGRYYIIKNIYGYSNSTKMYDVTTRELIYGKEDISKKSYVFEDLNRQVMTIKLDVKKYGDCKKSISFLCAQCWGVSGFFNLPINKAKEVIEALQEIIDYVEGEK